jgi:tetratricopeptide (TPR) repeat protein
MAQPQSLQARAEACIAEARGFMAAGRTDAALDALRRAIVLYAAADVEWESEDEIGPLKGPRADACRRLADALAAADLHAEAANIYQEATDLYGLFADEQARDAARECARLALHSVAALRAHPRDRLLLLVAHHDRALQQLALEEGSEREQAQRCTHVARIFQRRDRPEESISRYLRALELLDRCEESGGVQLEKAECHHRIGTLLALALHRPDAAIPHYRTAIDLYSAHEPFAYGDQPSLALCRLALSQAEALLPRYSGERDHEWSRE